MEIAEIREVDVGHGVITWMAFGTFGRVDFHVDESADGSLISLNATKDVGNV